MVGFWVNDYPEMVKLIDEAGIEIGTHSNTHPDFVGLSEEQMKLELTTSIDAIKNRIMADEHLFFDSHTELNNQSDVLHPRS